MLNIQLKPHRTALKSGTTEPQKLFAMLKLIPDAEVAATRPPLSLALVIDTSASMQAFADQEAARQLAKNAAPAGNVVDGGTFRGYDLNLPTLLDQAISAAHTMVDDQRFLPSDRITLVHFDDDARVLMPLTPISNRAGIHAAIELLRDYAGGTHMGKGLNAALGELGKVGPEVAKRAIVFTDGATFDEEECLQTLPEFARLNIPIIGVGFGEEYNDDLLKQLADATLGKPYGIKDINDFAALIGAEVAQSAREVVTNLRATISTVKGVTIDSISRVAPSLNDVDTSQKPFLLGNIERGDFTVFIVEMTISGVERPPSRARVAQIGLVAMAPALGKAQEFPPQNLFVEFTTDEAATAQVDPEVISYVQQKNVGKMVGEAMRTVSLDPGKARQTLQIAAGMTQRIGNGAATQMLQGALDELDKTGTISIATNKTVALGVRTKTVRTASMGDNSATGGLSPEEIRKLTGT
ncbi:hypothetical protein IAD21_03982 [Abditibacteriota bacterium]|nr:hypothetical protein IAD21_03982 [Abditibacteriota bacterium]